MRIHTIFFTALSLVLSAACIAPGALAASNPVGGPDGGAVSADAEQLSVAGLLEKARREKSRSNYTEAARLYRLALGAVPPEQKAAISIELATVLGWSGDYAGAIEIYSGLLSADPSNTEAGLGLARTYGWAKDYERAKEEYGKLLARDPRSTEARVGLARVLSWEETGRRRAVEIYREVLEKEPDNTEARVALSRTLWWSGDIDGALKEASAVVLAMPDDIGAARLERRLREERGPLLGVLWKSASDSDENKLTTYRASGYFNISPLLRLNVDWSRYNASRFSKKAHADVLTVRDTLRVTKELTVRPHLSYVSTGSDAGGHDYAAVGLSANWDFYPDTTAIFSYSYSPYVDTPTLIENNIRVSSYSATVMHHWPRYTGSVTLSFADYSDDNTSFGLRGNLSRKIYDRGPDVVVGYIPEYKSFSDKTTSGYYNPPEIISHDFYATVSGSYYMDALEYEATATIGQQATDSVSEFTSSLKAKVTGRLTRNLSAYAGYKWSRSALESATGFRSQEFMAGLDYLF